MFWLMSGLVLVLNFLAMETIAETSRAQNKTTQKKVSNRWKESQPAAKSVHSHGQRFLNVFEMTKIGGKSDCEMGHVNEQHVRVATGWADMGLSF